MSILISLTHRCNLKCSMCTQYGEGFKELAQNELSADEWDRFFESIAKINPKPEIILMGGEPLLYKDFGSVIRSLKKHQFMTTIVTNGILLKKYLPQLDGLELSIVLSIDGNEKTHDRIRNKKGVYACAIEAIEDIEEIEKLKFANLDVSVNTVILPENIDELEQFCKNISKYNLLAITFQHMQFTTDELDNISEKEWQERMGEGFGSCFHPLKPFIPDKDYVEKVKLFISKMRSNVSYPVMFFPYFEEDELDNYYFESGLKELRGGRICTDPWMSPSISPNGDVSNCINNVIGNIRNNDFWDIWNSARANKLRECLLRQGSFSVCKKCCNFYKGNFICAQESKIRINNKEYNLVNELNFIRSYRTVGIFEENGVVYPHSFMSKWQFDEYSKDKNLICLTDKL